MPSAASTDQTLTRAKKSARSGEWVVAHQLYQSVLDRFPGNRRARQGIEALKANAIPDLLRSAQEAQNKDLWVTAEANIAAAAALRPDMAEIGVALAMCRLDMGRAPDAVRAANAVLERAPRNSEALNAKARALREMGRPTDSEACLKAVLDQAGPDAQTLTSLGILARARGDRVIAAEHFRNAIALNPSDIAAHGNFAQTIRYTRDEPHIAELHNLLASSGNRETEAGTLCFSLFKAYDDLCEPEKAFPFLERGNRLTRAAMGYDFDKDAIRFASIASLFSNPVEPLTDRGNLTPIFVTGLPRSGTTLVERILSQAAGAQACGELNVVQVAGGRLLRDVTDRVDKSLTATDLKSLREDILAGLAEYSDGSPVLIDKTPLNFLWIGLIAAALPEARILHLSRDPMAVAWSLYRHAFAGRANGFVYDVADIAGYMKLHGNLMTLWRRSVPGRIHDVDYAGLVSDPVSTTKSMAVATGLEWTEGWLAPERATSQILTASFEQARKPIYGGSDNAWKRYEAQLAPLAVALRSAGVS